MKRAVIILSFLLAGSASAAPANPVPFDNRGSAETFIRDLYAHYDEGEAARPNLQGRDADVLAGPELLALIKRDHELVPDETGAYDGDPICACQDTDGMMLESVMIGREDKNSADAKVVLNFTSAQSHIVLDFTLVRIEGAWRIQNIIDETQDADTLKIFHYGVALEEAHPE